MGVQDGGVSKRYWSRKHDILFFYAKTKKYEHSPLKERIYYEQAFFTEQKDEFGRYYADVYIRDVWDIKPIINVSKERIGYPTQKPLALLERIIKASSNENDVVFDPFCGCATTCIQADALNREWVGIDISPKAVELVRQRLDDQWRKVIHRTDIPERTDLGTLPKPNSFEVRQSLYGSQSGYCNGCKSHFELRHFEIDHIIAQAKGGTDHLTNLQLLCGNCNRIKGDRGMEYLATKLQLHKH